MELIEIFKKKTKRFLSVDFGQTLTKIAYLESQEEGLKLLNYDFKKIMSPLEKKTETVEFINDFIKKNYISQKEVCLSISESDSDSIIIKPLILPVVPKEEISQAIKWQLKEEAPFDLKDALIDWQIIGEYLDEEGAKKIEIICILAKSEIIHKYLSIIDNCGLVPMRVSVSPFNYANILSHLSNNPPIVSVLDLGYKASILCVYRDNKLNFIRKLSFSSEKLTQSLTTVLALKEGEVELTSDKAEKIKETLGIPQDETLVLEDGIPAIYIISLIRPLLEGLVRELKRSFDYFSSNFKKEIPSILYLCGGGANIKNLNGYLNKELNIDVKQLPLPAALSVQSIPKERLSNDQNQLMSALGVALKGSGVINLLPEEVKAQRIELIERVSLRIVTIILGAIFLVSFFFIKFRIYDYRNRLKNARIHLQNIREIKLLKEKVDLREGLISKIQEKMVPVDGLLKLIGVIVPGNVILDELTLDQVTHTLVLKGTVSVGGESAISILTDFMKELEASPFFMEATLLTSRDVGGVHQFEIKTDLVH